MLYGKLFGKLYEGSMMGRGAAVFAVWCFIIAKQAYSKRWGSYVSVNPKYVAAVIGMEEGEVNLALEYLCSPDPHSGTKRLGGRRLVKIEDPEDSFGYQVVNGLKYMAIRNEEERREQTREAVARYRAKQAERAAKGNRGKPTGGKIPIKGFRPSKAEQVYVEEMQETGEGDPRLAAPGFEGGHGRDEIEEQHGNEERNVE